MCFCRTLNFIFCVLSLLVSSFISHRFVSFLCVVLLFFRLLFIHFWYFSSCNSLSLFTAFLFARLLSGSVFPDFFLGCRCMRFPFFVGFLHFKCSLSAVIFGFVSHWIVLVHLPRFDCSTISSFCLFKSVYTFFLFRLDFFFLLFSLQLHSSRSHPIHIGPVYLFEMHWIHST